MFKLEAFNPEIEAGSLTLSDSLFHDALREAPESLARFHVHNDKGEDFTLGDVADEEIPDFLLGEDVEIIGGDE